MFTNNTSLIIPTRNRVQHIKNLLNQIKILKLNFQEILVIDSSDKRKAFLVKNICHNNFIKYFHTKPSTAHQRNFGLSKIKKNKYVMFLDDDIVFFKNAFSKMNKVIYNNKDNDNVVGFGFNLIEKKKLNFLDKIKKSFFFEKILHLYSSKPGKILASGWHTPISNLKHDTVVEWIFSGACVFKSLLIKNVKFDVSLGKYAYLEDLDFSLKVTKDKKKIIVPYLAKFLNPNFINRNNFKFGITEIENRFKIVKKNNLNTKLFFISAFLRFSFSAIKILKFEIDYFKRALGNLVGIFNCIFKN